MTSVLDLPPVRRRGASALAGAGATIAHVAMALLALAGAGVAREVSAPLAVMEMVEIEPPPEPEAPAKPEPPQPKDPPPVRERSTPQEEPEEPPPSAAQAGQVLAADDVADFGDSFVTGPGTSYAGGVTDSTGTSTRAVRDVAARGAGAGRAVVTPPPVVDRSRPPRLAGRAQWDCPFPREADDEGVNEGVVTLRVEVRADGDVKSAVVARDPGLGFGREARRCALSKRWSAGLDRDGKAIEAVALVNVRFQR